AGGARRERPHLRAPRGNPFRRTHGGRSDRRGSDARCDRRGGRMSVTQTAPPPVQQRQVKRSALSRAGSWIAMPVGIVLVVIVGSVLSDRFFTVGNFVNILNSMSIVGIIVVGMTFVLISGKMADLSVPATVGT